MNHRLNYNHPEIYAILDGVIRELTRAVGTTTSENDRKIRSSLRYYERRRAQVCDDYQDPSMQYSSGNEPAEPADHPDGGMPDGAHGRKGAGHRRNEHFC